MKKEIFCILVMTLLITSTAISVTGAINIDKKDVKSKVENKVILNNQPWTIQFSFSVGAASGALGNAGSEFINNHFYSTRWASNLLHEYTSGGVLTKQFTIPNVSGLRDLAYCPIDGYLYGGAAGGTIWGFNPTTETLEETITGNFQCRAIAYNENLDVFYVSNWGDPVWVVERSTGNVLSQFYLNTTTSTYGFAYDNVCNGGGPYLWVFDQGGSGAEIHQWDLTSGGYTGVFRDVAADFPHVTGAVAGGLFFTEDFVTNTATLGGLLQGVNDTMFCYEICQKCGADIDVEKLVWDPNTGAYVDADTEKEALDLPHCTYDSHFKIVITNTGDCPLKNITVTDIMDDGLEYLGASPNPDYFQHIPPEYRIKWYIDELDETEVVEILIEFHVTGDPCDIRSNYVKVDGTCIPHGTYVEDEDWCYIHVSKVSRDYNRPIIEFFENYLSKFPILQKLLQLLGL
jgi:uncharacterized repeat protein (TIGR01451 family)